MSLQCVDKFMEAQGSPGPLSMLPMPEPFDRNVADSFVLTLGTSLPLLKSSKSLLEDLLGTACADTE